MYKEKGARNFLESKYTRNHPSEKNIFYYGSELMATLRRNYKGKMFIYCSFILLFKKMLLSGLGFFFFSLLLL